MKHDPPFFVLLADDDPDDRLLFKKAFSELSLRTIVQTVNDGIELMELLTKKAALLPKIIFLDLNMPRKNGLECLREIKNNKKFKEILIAIYSTSASEKNIEDAFRFGANVYIHKPSDFRILKKVLDRTVVASWHYQDPPFNKENFLLRI
ncbi:MAG: response regulator [Chitinophagales bacterium]